MNKEGYLSKQKQLTDCIEQCQKQLKVNKQEYIKEHAKLLVGDKVLIKGYDYRIKENVELFAYISNVSEYDGGILYGYNKAKNDGTMSSQRFHLWRFENVTIEKA